MLKQVWVGCAIVAMTIGNPVWAQHSLPEGVTVTPSALFMWAPAAYPHHFPGAYSDGQVTVAGYGTFAYRYWPATGNYIGLLGNDVYLYGPVSSNQIQFVGTLESFACQVFDCTAPNDSPAAPSWVAAQVFLPYSNLATTSGALAGRPPAPVVIFLHGCNGLGSGPAAGPLLAGLGYIVIMPDSLARPDRAGRSTCSGASAGAGNFDIYDKRIEEAEYAIQRTLAEPWFDRQHLLLYGHSEGGFTVARRMYSGITAALVTGYWCTGSGRLSVADGAPTLTVNYLQDPWYYGVPGYGLGPACGGGLPGSVHLVFEGAGHNPVFTDEGRAAITDFARTQLSPP